MKAAVVHNFKNAPSYDDFEDPVAAPHQTLIRVTASALSPLVKSQAAGTHYSSVAQFPFVPGVDGVGRRVDGSRVYFAVPPKPFGGMAEQVAVNTARVIAVPDEVDDVTAAAVANPGMSSMAALTVRAKLQRGEVVLINGATGSAGRMAVQIAKYRGASKVIATGRNIEALEALKSIGADEIIALDPSPEKMTALFHDAIAAHGVSVILDYLWGPSAESLLAAVTGHGGGAAAPRIRFVNIGSSSGGAITLNAGSLRSSGIELIGSGIGSVSTEDLVHCIGEVLKAVVPAKLKIDAEPVPLKDVEMAWNQKDAGRVVFTI